MTLPGGGCGSRSIYLIIANNCGSSQSSNYLYTRNCLGPGLIINPNPATESVFVDLETDHSFAVTNSTEFEGIRKIQLINKNGVVIKEFRFSGRHQREKVNLSNVVSGIYFIKAYNGREWLSASLFKR